MRGADRLATRLARWGVDRGDRVGLWLPKSLEAVTAIHGILRTGASYVPVDPTGPAARAAGILAASGVKAAVVAAELVPALRAAWPGSGPLPRLIVVEGLAGTEPGRPGNRGRAADPGRRRRCRLGRGHRRRCAVAALAAPRGGRPGVHPLHLGLDRPAQGRDALARQRLHVPRLVPADAGPVGRRRPVRLARPVPLRPVGVRPLRRLPERGDAGADRREPGQGPRPARRLPGRAADQRLVLGARRSSRCWPSTAGWTARASRRRGWCSSPARSSRWPRCGGCERSGRGPRCGTSTGRPRPTSAPPIRSPRRSPPIATEPLPDRPGLPAAPRPGRRRARPRRAAGHARRAGDRRPRRDARLFRPARADRRGVPRRRRRHALVPHRRPGHATTATGCFQFHGRRDRMVKKRGYRIELGEIESALYRHDGVDRAGVVAQAGRSRASRSRRSSRSSRTRRRRSSP